MWCPSGTRPPFPAKAYDGETYAQVMAAQESEHRPGRDGVSGLVTPSRAMRAREVSRPTPEELAEAVAVAAEIVRRRRPVTQA